MNKTDTLIKFDVLAEQGNFCGVVTPWGRSLMSIPSLVSYVLIRLAGQLSKDGQDPKAEYVYEINVTNIAEEDYFWVRIGKLDGEYFYHSANGYKLTGLDADRFILFMSQDTEYGLRRAIPRASKGVIQVGRLQM